MLSAAFRRGLGRAPLTTTFPAAGTQLRAFGGGGTGRERVRPDGRRVDPEDISAEWEHFPTWYETGKGNVYEPVFQERGKWWTRGKNTNANMERLLHWLPGNPKEYPSWGRQRLSIHGNISYNMKVEYILFYVPVFLIIGLGVPAFCMIYAMEDAMNCEMVVKVTGRQWFWVYEVESPTGDDDDEDDD